jgi:flagellar motor switch protein FliG
VNIYQRVTNFISKKLSNIGLIMLLSMIIPSASFAQFREEIASLEDKYESRARAVLNTVLKPYEYSLVVAVDIDRDEERLKNLEGEYEKNLLPGMPGAAGYETPALANQLYELKTKVEVHLVVNETVSKERQETAGTLLKMKLRLEEKNGDTLTIVRSKLPSNSDEENPVEKLPELSWKMWVLIVVLGLLFLSGMFFYWSRRNTNESKKDDEQQRDKKDAPKKDKDDEQVAEAPAAATPFDIELDPSEILFESKQQILSLATQYPQATIQALSEHFQKGEENDILLMCESFGFEVAKKIFADFSPRIWGRLGYLLVQRSSVPKTTEYSEAVATCGRVILKKFLEIGQDDTKNPFGFIWKLNPSDRMNLLKGESASNLAMVCLYSDKQQMADLFESISSDQQEAITMHIVRLEKVSDSVLKSVSETLIKKLRVIKENPEMVTNGVAIAADLLKALAPEKELTFFEKMRVENPEQAEKVRRFTLMYADIMYVPGDIIADMASLLDLNVIVMALRKGHEEVKGHILSSLPPKKALMIEKDLKYIESKPTDNQVAVAKRAIVTELMVIMRARGIEVETIIPIETSGKKQTVRDVSQGAA